MPRCRFWALFLLLTLLSLSCGAPGEAVPVVVTPAQVGQDTNRSTGLAVAAAADAGDPGPVPVTAADPSWGAADALVTIVEFADFQCPFSKRVAGTLDDLRKHYGPRDLRIVWKNNPLPFHPLARPAAQMSAVLHARLGNGAFWSFYEAVYLTKRPFEEALYDDALQAAGLTKEQFEAATKDGRAAAKVDADVALAKDLGASGTPAFFINGSRLSGAQPLEKYQRDVNHELGKAKAMVASGTPRRTRVCAGDHREPSQARPPPPTSPRRPNRPTPPSGGSRSAARPSAARRPRWSPSCSFPTTSAPSARRSRPPSIRS